MYNKTTTTNQGDTMDLIPRTSYAKEFKAIKEFYDSHAPYNGWDMDCADLFRDYEWMLTDDADYAENTLQDLHASAASDKKFLKFLDNVISSMKYNLRQIED